MFRFEVRLLCLLGVLPATAWLGSTDGPIVIWDDRADSLYLALGAQFPAVAQIGRAGDGTLIAERWVLTAGHVAAGIDLARAKVHIGGRTYDIQRAIVHPRWRELGPHDIGLLELTSAVTGVTPLAPYEGRDEEGRLWPRWSGTERRGLAGVGLGSAMDARAGR